MQRFSLTILLQTHIYILAAGFALKAQTPKQAITSVETLIDNLNIALFNHYIFPDKSKAIADYLKIRLKQKAYNNITDPSKLSSQLQTDINSIHRDLHLRVYYEPQLEADLETLQAHPS